VRHAINASLVNGINVIAASKFGIEVFHGLELMLIWKKFHEMCPTPEIFAIARVQEKKRFVSNRTWRVGFFFKVACWFLQGDP
jgi:hypothetical protein